jgi:DnaK suppressor protein
MVVAKKKALTKSEIEAYKVILTTLRAKMNKQILSTSEDVKTVEDTSGYSQHQADQGTDNFCRTISLELTNKERGVLRQIDRALEKIEEGTYGICDISEETIPKPRLDAVPYACMTVASQEKVEKGLL